MDAQLVEKIVHEVKSQGVFDEFRRDSMADVDTKPAYQNLRQRVERSVKKFLAEQTWTPDTNKNQLREKLRRHITESGYLDVGVERIVDQVVNPKIRSVFQPRIEEIAYKYLGIPPPPKEDKPPPPPLMHPLPPLPLNRPTLEVDTCNLLPNGLEQVSPDSDKATVKSENLTGECDMDVDLDKDQDDDEESPPFEPLMEEKLSIDNDKETKEETCGGTGYKNKRESDESQISEVEKSSPQENNLHTEKTEKDAISPLEGQVPQDSLLSNISNDSSQELSKVEDKLVDSRQETAADANISEEAQMPKFGENSNEPTEQTTPNTAHDNDNTKVQLHFDINKDEIKFEGTERKPIIPERISPLTQLTKETEEKESLCENDVSKDAKQTKSAFVFDTCDISKSKSNSVDAEFQCASNTQHSMESYAEDTTSTDYADIKSKDTVKKRSDVSVISKEGRKYSNSLTSSPTLSPTNNQIERKSEYSPKLSSPSSSSSTNKHSRKHKHSDNKTHQRDRHHRSRSHVDERNKDKNSHRDHHHRRHHHHQQHSHHQRYNDKYDNGRQSKTSRKEASTSLNYKHKSGSKESKTSHSLKYEKHLANVEDKLSSHSEQSLPAISVGVKRNKIKDDHQEIKSKLYRRKSHDSNDDDDDDHNKPSGPARGQQMHNAHNVETGNNGIKSVASNTSSSSSGIPTTATATTTTATAKAAFSSETISAGEIQATITTIATLITPTPTTTTFTPTPTTTTFTPTTIINTENCEFGKNVKDEYATNTKCIDNNIVVLNDVLVNPLTRFVDLNFERSTNNSCVCDITMTSKNNHNNHSNTNYNNNIELIHKMPKEKETKERSTLFDDENGKDDLFSLHEETLFLELQPEKLNSERLNVINKALVLYEDTLKYFNTSECHKEDIEEFSDSTNDDDVNYFDKNYPNDLMATKSYHNPYNNVLPNKCLKLDNNQNDLVGGDDDHDIDGTQFTVITKISPVSSDLSVNSKENDGFDKHTNVIGIEKKLNVEENQRSKYRSIQKLTQQQRYSNEDLYKPRPILSQRTKRRGMDPII